jgi:rhodanese-related sulfurtransferase
MNRLLEFIAHHPGLATASGALILVILLYELRMRAENRSAVSPQDVIRLMNQGALLLDLRPQEQYAAGHLQGARLMNGEQILKASDTLKKHKEKTVVVYDESGSLGGAAVRQLASQGFTRVFTLRGGLAAWRADNLPVSRA